MLLTVNRSLFMCDFIIKMALCHIIILTRCEPTWLEIKLFSTSNCLPPNSVCWGTFLWTGTLGSASLLQISQSNRWSLLQGMSFLLYIPTWFLGHVLLPEARMAEKLMAVFSRRLVDSAPWINVLQSQTAQEKEQQGCCCLQQLSVGLIYL